MPHSSLLMQPMTISMTMQLWVSAIKIAVFIIVGHQLGVRERMGRWVSINCESLTDAAESEISDARGIY